ncbi:Putative G3BP-like protein [Termitomyces sp. J132]|nr:Putative G3BP-like protein [Termitomyces sp. J132]
MTNSTPSTPVVPSEVGWQFVPQYYTFVNKQPDRLHCFYTKASTFIHGTEGEEGSPCFGQQEIHNKITSIGFEDCKVFIHSVDAQSSANGGIIIQVIGEMSNHGEPWRKQPQPQQQQPQQQHHHHHQHGGSTPTYGPIAAASITTAHCFVKGIIDPITQPLLTSTLAARFGPLKEIEIVRSKACAFIEFQSIESARRAISQSPFWIDVGADGPQLRISVETKKERGERPPSRPRGGAPVNGGAGPGEGRGGWKRGAPRGRGAPVAK